MLHVLRFAVTILPPQFLFVDVAVLFEESGIYYQLSPPGVPSGLYQKRK